MGFLMLAALAVYFPAAGALVFGLIFLEVLIRRILPWFFRTLRERSRQFRYLSPLDQKLQHGSQGFALVVLSIGAAVLLHVEFFSGQSLTGVTSRPLEMWPLLGCLAAFIAGAVWLFDGASKVAGARDAARWFYGAVRLGAGAVAVFYLWRFDLFGQFGRSPAGVLLCAAVFAVALFFVLGGFMRVLLLSWPRGGAEGKAGGWIRDNEPTWADQQRRRGGFFQSKGGLQ